MLATALAAVVLATGVLTACSGDDDRSSDATTTTAGAATTTTGDGAPPSTAALGSTPVRLVDLDLDVDQPIDLTFRPDSTSLLVAQRGGLVREAVRDDDGFRLADEPVIDLTRRVGGTDGERGLLGIAVGPDGRHLYASYTEADHGDSRLDEYPLSGDDGSLRADPDGRRQLVAISQPAANHNGGSLRFAPDGTLLAGFGDGGGQNDPDGNGQSRATKLGKILRIDPGSPDGVPADNPFVDGPEPLIWATGLRNPWRIDVDPASGDLWIGDVGQNRYEEVDLLPAAGTADAGPRGRGANLGWDLYEGTSRFDDPDPAPGAASAGPFVAPVLTYSHDEGCSITGGVVVRDPALSGLAGAFLYGDYCQPGIRAVRIATDGTAQQADLGLDVSSVVSFGRGPDGAIYVISLDGGVQRLAPA